MTDSVDVVVLSNRPSNRPVEDDFSVEQVVLPPLKEGDVRVRTLYLSVDPYLRGLMRDDETTASPRIFSHSTTFELDMPIQSRGLGRVVESNHSNYQAGDVITGPFDWAEEVILQGESVSAVELTSVPLSTALGVLGGTGRTAYFGLLDVGEPLPGDTVVVSAAAGSVGSVVGQIARKCGCRVVGIAGSEEKISYLVDELGFDAGLNYKRTSSLSNDIDRACPDGVDVYFDNVGGEISDGVMAHLATGARVVVCGQISYYNAESIPQGPRDGWILIEKRARVEGFSTNDYEARFPEATRRLESWVADGSIRYRESITDGLEDAPSAFIELFSGGNIGKSLVKVHDADRGTSH